MLHFDPPVFACPEHGVDLTDLVAEVLDEQPLPNAFGWGPLFGRPGRKDFEVLVNCPGDPAEGTGHQVAFEGKFWL